MAKVSRRRPGLSHLVSSGKPWRPFRAWNVLRIWRHSQGVALGYPILPLRGSGTGHRMSGFTSRIGCPLSPAEALHGPNEAFDGPKGALDVPNGPLHGDNGTLDGPTGALAGPNGATWDSPGCNPGFTSGINPSALKGPDRAGPNGATWDSPGCNPGFASGIYPSALKGPYRDTPRFRRIQAIKANLRRLGYGG